MVLVYLTIFTLILCANTASITDKIISKRQSEAQSNSKSNSSNNFEPRVKSNTNKLLTINGQCHIINKFSVADNLSFACNQKYLPIQFVLQHFSGEDRVYIGYMNPTSNELSDKQVTSNCRKIRRYCIK